MIQIRDWIPIIPEEDKHIGYVGENKSEKREFALICPDWKNYEHCSFYLDIAFDLASVTSSDSRQMVQTEVGSTENISETVVKTNATTTETSYTLTSETVDCESKTDVVHLNHITVGGAIMLYWTIAREHTQLPGRLYCTLRAVHSDGRVKKSAIMVFEVDPAVEATPAVKITDNEFQQMERKLQTMIQETSALAEDVTEAAQKVEQAATQFAADEALDATSANPVSNRALTPILNGLQETVEEQALEMGLTDARVSALEQYDRIMDTRVGALETQSDGVDSRLVALEQRPAITVDTVFDGGSDNPLANRVITERMSGIISRLDYGVQPYLLPQVTSAQTYYILRVAMDGRGFEFIPIQQDAYIQQWILPYLLPRVSDADNGKTMQVVNGEWKLV